MSKRADEIGQMLDCLQEARKFAIKVGVSVDDLALVIKNTEAALGVELVKEFKTRPKVIGAQ